MDFTLKEWVNMAGKGSIAGAAVQMQAHESGMTVEEVREVMLHHLHCMQEAVKDGLDATLRSVSGLSGGQAAVFLQRLQAGKSLCGSLLGKAEVYALATAECNACMGKIVAAPTAGACGILPGAVLAMMEERNISERKAVDALFVAAAVGQTIATRASISGAEGGCQAECGSAAAMPKMRTAAMAGKASSARAIVMPSTTMRSPPSTSAASTTAATWIPPRPSSARSILARASNPSSTSSPAPTGR